MDSSVTVVIPADLNEVEKVAIALEETMRASGFSEDVVHELQLAVEEAIVNTVVHGYCGTLGDVAVEIHATREAVEVRIEDRAPPFDPLAVPEPDRDADLDERGIGGLGVYLIRNLVDEVAYRYTGGKNVLTLVKRSAS